KSRRFRAAGPGHSGRPAHFSDDIKTLPDDRDGVKKIFLSLPEIYDHPPFTAPRLVAGREIGKNTGSRSVSPALHPPRCDSSLAGDRRGGRSRDVQSVPETQIEGAAGDEAARRRRLARFVALRSGFPGARGLGKPHHLLPPLPREGLAA